MSFHNHLFTLSIVLYVIKVKFIYTSYKYNIMKIDFAWEEIPS